MAEAAVAAAKNVRRDIDISQDTNGDGFKTNKDQIDLYIAQPDGSNERNLTQGRYSISTPTWSPSSDQILFAAYYGEARFELVTYNLATGQFTPLGTGIGPYYHPRWGP